jgi:hypothetical protein
MEVSNRTALIVVASAAVVIGAFMAWKMGVFNKKKNNFTRTCLTADSNCQFVRSHVDYVYKDQTEIPTKKGMDFPHFMANPTDKLQPLDEGRIDLIKDERKLNNQDLLWKQYEHDWKGCGNGKPYIVNDEKTRFSLVEVGDVWAERQLYGMDSPMHHKGNIRALTEQDAIVPEPFDRLYGGSNFLDDHIGN